MVLPSVVVTTLVVVEVVHLNVMSTLGHFSMVDSASSHLERLDLWQELCSKVSTVGTHV